MRSAQKCKSLHRTGFRSKIRRIGTCDSVIHRKGAEEKFSDEIASIPKAHGSRHSQCRVVFGSEDRGTTLSRTALLANKAAGVRGKLGTLSAQEWTILNGSDRRCREPLHNQNQRPHITLIQSVRWPVRRAGFLLVLQTSRKAARIIGAALCGGNGRVAPRTVHAASAPLVSTASF